MGVDQMIWCYSVASLVELGRIDQSTCIIIKQQECGRRVRPTWHAPPASNDIGTTFGQDGSD